MQQPASIRLSEYMHKGNTSLGSVPATDGGLVPSHKDLVACADKTAVLTVIDADAERPSVMAGP